MSDHLIDHKYTVLEIERMRTAVFDLMFPQEWIGRNSSTRAGWGGRYGENEQKVEQQLRTYMLAGTRPEELEATQKEREELFERQRPGQ